MRIPRSGLICLAIRTIEKDFSQAGSILMAEGTLEETPGETAEAIEIRTSRWYQFRYALRASLHDTALRSTKKMRILFLILFAISLLTLVFGMVVFWESPRLGASILTPSAIYLGCFTIAYILDDQRNKAKRMENRVNEIIEKN